MLECADVSLETLILKMANLPLRVSISISILLLL